jgi:biotin carboxylase
MPSILVVRASARDELNLADERVRSRFDLTADPAPGESDPVAYVDAVADDPRVATVDGAFGSQDQTMHLAVRVADRLGLPGPSPESFMRCHDKLEARRWQQRIVPEATPRFAPLDPDTVGNDPPLDVPFFMKPTTGHLSQLAFTIRDRDELSAALARVRRELDAVTWFDRRLEKGEFRHMLAEELLTGRQVTFEGFMHAGSLTPVGMTDSILHPNGISFLRFDYPSAVPSELQRRMAGIAERFMRGIEFEGSLFNMDFFVGPGGDLKIIEVNGRMASQFGPLVKAVHGMSTYEVQLELMSGGLPELPPARSDLVASSFVLRTYEDAIVEAVPDPAAVLERYPHAQVELLVRPGQRLSDNDDDVASHRLALVALAAPTREAVLARYEEAKRLLRFDLRPAGDDHVAPGEGSLVPQA